MTDNSPANEFPGFDPQDGTFTMSDADLENNPAGDKIDGAPDDSKYSDQDDDDSGGGDSLDEATLAEAKQYGIDPESIKGLPADQVSSIFAAIDRRATEMASRRGQQQQPPQQVPYGGMVQGMPPGMPPSAWPQWNGVPGAPFQQQMPQHPQGQQPPQQFQPYELKLDKNNWDPELLSAVEGMNKHYQDQFQQVQQSLQAQQMWYQQQMGQLQQQQSHQYSAWFDAKISELGDEYTSVFGRGGYDTLREGSAEKANRLALNDAIDQLAQISPHATDDELFVRAMRMQFGHIQSQIQRQKLSDQIKSRSKQTVGRPGVKPKGKSKQVDPESGVAVDDINDLNRMMSEMLES